MAPVQSRFQRGNQRSNGPPRGGVAGSSTKQDFFYDPTKDGDVPWWDGSAKNWADYVTAVQWYVASTKADQRQLCGPRLIRRLRKTARKAVKKLKPSDIAGIDGWKSLLRFLETAVATEPVPDMAHHLEQYFFQLHRRKGDSMLAYIQHEEHSYEELRKALQ